MNTRRAHAPAQRRRYPQSGSSAGEQQARWPSGLRRCVKVHRLGVPSPTSPPQSSDVGSNPTLVKRAFSCLLTPPFSPSRGVGVGERAGRRQSVMWSVAERASPIRHVQRPDRAFILQRWAGATPEEYRVVSETRLAEGPLRYLAAAVCWHQSSTGWSATEVVMIMPSAGRTG